MKTSIILIAFLLSGFGIDEKPMPSWARFGEDVRIDSPVKGDVYISGGTVTINAPVDGDVVAAGGTIIINDSVTMDVLVAGGRVTINGNVGDDVRCAGGSVVISALVSGDALVTGGEFFLQRQGRIKGNLTLAGGVLDVDGVVDGDLCAAGGDVDIRGVLNGGLEVRGEQVNIEGIVKGHSSIAANTITIGPDARFEKDIRFWNDEKALAISPSAHAGEVVFDQALEINNGRWELLGFASVLMLVWYLGTALVVIWFVEYLFSKSFLKAAGVALNQSARSIGYGAVFLIGVPVLCVLLGVTVLALPIAVIVLISYITLVVLATVITAIIASNWINRVYYRAEWSMSRIVFVAFGIFVFLKLMTLTPVVGPLIMLVMICLAFGAILISVRKVPTQASQ